MLDWIDCDVTKEKVSYIQYYILYSIILYLVRRRSAISPQFVTKEQTAKATFFCIYSVFTFITTVPYLGTIQYDTVKQY